MATSIVNQSTLSIRGAYQEVAVKRKLSELPPYTYTANGHVINLQHNLFGDHLPYLISVPPRNSYTTDSFATSANKEIDFEIGFMPDYKLIDSNSLWLQIPVQETAGSNAVIANFVEAWFDYRKSVYYLQNGKEFYAANLGNMLFEPAMSMTQTQNVNHDASLDPLSCNSNIFIGTGGQTEIQSIPVGSTIPTGGNMLFEIFGEKTVVLPYNALTEQVQSAINGLPAMRKRGLVCLVIGSGASLSVPTVSYNVNGSEALFKTAAITQLGFQFFPAGPVGAPLIMHNNTTGGTAHIACAHGVTNLKGNQNGATGCRYGALPAKIFYLRLPSPFDQEGLYLGAVRPDQPIICRIRTADARKFGTSGATTMGTFAIMTNPGLNLLMQCNNIPPDDKKDYNTYWNSPGRRWKKEVCYLFEPASATTLAYSGKTPRIKLDTLQDVICSKAILIPHFGRQFTGFTNVYGGLGFTTPEELNNTTSTNYFYPIILGTPVSPAQIWLENANGVQIFTGNGKYTEWHQKVEMLRKGDTKLWTLNARGYILWDFGDILKQQYNHEVGALFKFTGEEFLVIQDSGIGTGATTAATNPTGSSTASLTGLWPTNAIFLDIYAFSPIWYENTGSKYSNCNLLIPLQPVSSTK